MVVTMFNWSCTNSNRPPFPAWILILDYILPFAAVPEDGHEIDRLDNKSKLAHCIMLFNLLRTLTAQEARRTLRAGPDTWLAAWHCHWVSKCCWSRSKSDSGVFQIIWTRSTQVLPIQLPKNLRHTAFTHSPLAFILGLTLTHPLFFKQHHPSECSIVLLPATMQLISRLSMVLRASMSFSQSTVNVVPRANFKFNFPALESTSTLKQLSKMRGSYRKLSSSPVSLKLGSSCTQWDPQGWYSAHWLGGSQDWWAHGC